MLNIFIDLSHVKYSMLLLLLFVTYLYLILKLKGTCATGNLSIYHNQTSLQHRLQNEPHAKYLTCASVAA